MIPILPTTPADIARLNLRIKTLKDKGLTHALKKAPGSKKRKKPTATKTDIETAGAKTCTPQEDEKATKIEKEERVNPTTSNGIKNSSTASLTKKVLAEQDVRNKRRKLGQNENVRSLFSKEDRGTSMGNSSDYMTRGFSIGRK